MIFEEKFIYFPSVYPEGYYNEVQQVLRVEDCWFTSEDGIKLHGWFASSRNPIATLLISHGNAGNISHRIPIMHAFQQSGFNVFMYDYRGYGRSQGSPNEEGIYRDGRAAFDFVARRSDIDPTRIVLFGTSVGGAVAVDVATHRPACALILESTFTSAKDMARVLYSFLPAQWLVRTQFNSEKKIRSLPLPVLVMHGTHDSIVPVALGRKLFNAANSPKEFYEIPGANHNDTFWVGGKAYLDRIRSFVTRHFSSPEE